MSQVGSASIALTKLQRCCQENCAPSDKTSFVGESGIIKYAVSDDSKLAQEDSDEIIVKYAVDRGTMTEEYENGQLECRYCVRRMSILKKIEKIKSFRESLFLGSRMKYDCVQRTKRNRKCQTSASFDKTAEMTFREMKSLVKILELRNVKSQRKGEKFCKCVESKGWDRDCRCGEQDKCFEWVWDSVHHGQSASFKEEDSLAVFHENYSCGTTAVRGAKAMDRGQHFWEIKMTTPVYGTDMMVGVGTANVELSKFHNTFCSMLGCDFDSWGISYDGRIQHAGKKKKYCCRFGQSTIIGIHLDTWHGTLTFYKNRQSLGVAFGGLRGRTLFPMASSTAARSGMRVISSRSFPSSLQFLCCQKLRQSVPSQLSVLDTVPMPPGLRSFLANNIAWLLHVPPTNPPKPTADYVCHICMPLKSAFDGHTDEDGSSDEERIDHSIFRDSDDDTDEEPLDNYFLVDYLTETSERRHRRMLSLDSSFSLASNLPMSLVRAASPLAGSDSWRSLGTSTVSSSDQKARLDDSFHSDDDSGRSDGTSTVSSSAKKARLDDSFHSDDDSGRSDGTSTVSSSAKKARLDDNFHSDDDSGRSNGTSTVSSSAKKARLDDSFHSDDDSGKSNGTSTVSSSAKKARLDDSSHSECSGTETGDDISTDAGSLTNGNLVDDSNAVKPPHMLGKRKQT